MAFDKAIKSGKEKRKAYRKARSASCRNNGSCAHCRSNRTIRNQKLALAAKDAMKEVSR